MAGPYYVRFTGGSDADSGLTWALAKATLAGALAVAAAGERIWVSQAHSETQATAMTLTSLGNSAFPVEIFCGNDAAQPPTALATTAIVATTGASNISFAGHAHVYGIQFRAGSAASQGHLQWTSGTSWRWRLEACDLNLNNTAGGSRIYPGQANMADSKIELVNSTCTFGATGQGIQPYSPFEWTGGSASAGPTAGLIKPAASGSCLARIRGVDLSALGANPLVAIATGAAGGLITFEQCKLGASAVLTTGTNPGPGQAQVWLDNCDSADTQYRMQRYGYEGSVYSETTIVRTGGASNGTTPIAHKMVSSANRNLHSPLYGPELSIWNGTTGTAKTVTIEIVHDAVANLQNDEVWLEVEYLGTAGTPLSLFANDRMATMLSTPADQTASSVAWTTTGLTNPNKQKLEVTVTPQEIGYLRCRVALAVSFYTIYVDPLPTVT